jgi:hypothetical protein
MSNDYLATSIDTWSVSLNHSPSPRAVNHQIVAGWALSVGQLSFDEIMPFCMIAAIWTSNFLCYTHCSTLVFQRVLKKETKN